jgi:ABC-type glycerol-3-phosphate transport system substrate-binding protein
VRTAQSRMWLVAVLAVAVALAIGAALALSGRDDGPAAASATGPTTTVAAATTEPPTTAAPASTETTTAPVSGKAASCQPAAFLPVLQRELDSRSGPRLASVEVERCRGGYARVSAEPASQDTDTLQAFLRADAGTWAIIDYGTDLECDAHLATACRGLGYPLTGSS